MSYKEGNAVVTYDPARTGDKEIIQAVKKLGYEAKVKENPKTDSDA